MNTKFLYLRERPTIDPNGTLHRGKPFGCVASHSIPASLNVLPATKYLCYAISVASMKDEFRKDIARKIALGRLETGGFYRVEYDPSIIDTHSKIIYMLMVEIMHNKKLPARARNVATRWVKEYEERSISKRFDENENTYIDELKYEMDAGDKFVFDGLNWNEPHYDATRFKVVKDGEKEFEGERQGTLVKFDIDRNFDDLPF